MLGPNAIHRLEDQYARLKGSYFAIEREAEDFSGAELLDKIREIENRQKKLIIQMEAIRRVIQGEQPSWDQDAVKAIRPQKKGFQNGEISRRIFKILGQSEEPLSIRELAKLVQLDIESESIEASDYTDIRRSICSYVYSKQGVYFKKHETKPFSWSVIPTARKAKRRPNRPHQTS